MIKKIFTVSLCLVFFFVLFFNQALAQKAPEIHFFYGKTCPHCLAEEKFLDELSKKYPQVKINRYAIEETSNQKLLEKLCQECGAERYIGLVPLTFVNEEFFVGFDSPAGVGAQIEQAIQRQLKKQDVKEKKISFPIIGEVTYAKYSLPVFTIILGTLDGFNVCSLGALVLILGLVLTLGSRKKILIFGGTFVLATALVYGLLIVLWYKFFSFLAPYLKLMSLIIGCLGIGGGIYFFRQFLKFKKLGPACPIEVGKGIISKLSGKLEESFKRPTGILAILGVILVFAFIITTVEFPCSAAIPVVFAGILADFRLPVLVYLFYIALFVLFYLLDEILVFLVAVFKMTVWLGSPRFVIWITLLESIFLFILGGWYMMRLFI